MAKTDSKTTDPITVKISSAANALDEINSAIDKALKAEDSNLNKQFQEELKLQGQLSNLEDQLNLSGMVLNGPMVGLSIPTLAQLYAPLRKILEDQYPCDANPFIGDVAPSIKDNPALIPILMTANGGDKGGTHISVGSFPTTIPGTSITAQVVAGVPIVGPGIPDGTSIVAVDTTNKIITLSNELTTDASYFADAYYVTNVADLSVLATGGGSSPVIALNGSYANLATGMVVDGPGVAENATISSIDTNANTITLSTDLTGPISGDSDAYNGITTVSIKGAKGAAGQATITTTNTTGAVVGMTAIGTGIPADTTVVSISSNTSVTLSKPLTVKASGTVTLTSKTPFTAFPSQGSIIETASAEHVVKGMYVLGTGVPDGTVITKVVSSTKGAAQSVTINLNKIMTAPASGNTYTIVAPEVINYWVQQLIHKALDSDLTSLLANYKNTQDASLEEEVVFYIQKMVSEIVERDLILSKLVSGAKAMSENPEISTAEIGLVQDALDNSVTLGVDTKIESIESMYYDSLNGFDSKVFPPPGGRDFLTNLENQVMVSVNQSVSSALKPRGKKQPSAAEVAALHAVQHEQAVVRSGVHDALFNKIAELGIQGTLLADALDSESSKGILQNIESLLDGIDTFKIDLTNLNTTAKDEAQSVLSAHDAVADFLQLWDVANDALQANASTLGSGEKSFDSLNSTMNGSGEGNRPYIAVLATTGSGGQLSVMDDIESRSTQITAELAGLLFMANSILVKQAPLNQVKGLDAIISAQFEADVNNLKAALDDYAAKLTAYLSGYQDYKEVEDTVLAATTVVGSVPDMLGAAPSTSPQF